MDDAVAQSARRRGLYLLREIARVNPDRVAALLTMDARSVSDALDQPVTRLGAALAFLRLRSTGSLSEDVTERFLTSLRESLEGVPTDGLSMLVAEGGLNGCTFLGRCSLLDELVGPHDRLRLVASPATVRTAFERGLAAISACWPEEASQVRVSVDLVAGLDGARAEIRCFSNIHLPGFIAIAVNGPDAILAEQIVHESTHVRLALLLENEGHLGDTVALMPPAYSPFSGSVRPAERVLHGVVSYSRVLAWWEALRAFQRLPPEWLDCSCADEADAVIMRRIATLQARVRSGWLSLMRAAHPSERQVLSEIHQRTVGPPLDVPAPPLNVGPVAARLAPIARAEFLLAAHGLKASRLHCDVHDEAFLQELLASGACFTFSRQAFRRIPEEGLRGFSNTFGESCDILAASKGDEVLCYIADSVDGVRITAERDANLVAGQLYGIPACCQSHFQAQWPTMNRDRADLFGRLLEAASRQTEVRLPWQCNAAAMYFGGGLCWHFPCSLSCEATIALVDNRYADLRRLDPGLADELVSIQQAPFRYSPRDGYLEIASGGDSPLVVPS